MISSIALSTFITLGGWSVHDKKYIDICKDYTADICVRRKYNSNHNSLIIDHKGFTIGTYKNSFYNRTNLIGYTYRIKSFSFAAAYGTGYRIDGYSKACPLKLGKECALFSASYTYKNVKLSLMGEALSVAFEFKLW